MSVHGKGTNVFIGDFDASNYLSAANGVKNIALASDDRFGNPGSAKKFLAGIEAGTVNVQGIGNFDASAVDEEFAAGLATEGPWTIAPAGADAAGDYGKLCIVANSIQNQYDIRTTPNDAVRIVAGGQSNFQRVGGIVLHPKISQSGAFNGTSHDHGASTAFGAGANLHVFSFTGTSATIVVADSPTDSVYSDVGFGFAAVTGVTSEHAIATGTIDRWTRVQVTGTFSEITFALGFARNRS